MASAKRPLYSDLPQRRTIGMFVTKQHHVMARTLGMAILAAASLSACATYDDEFAGINTRLD